MPFAQIAPLAELSRFSERAAKASSLLAQVHDEDVRLAQAPREEVARIGQRVLYRIALEGPGACERPSSSSMLSSDAGPFSTFRKTAPSCAISWRPDASSTCSIGAIRRRPIAIDDFSDLVNLYMDEFVDVIRKREKVEKG